MRIFITCLFFLVTCSTTAQELIISSYLFDANSNNPIPYASIIDITDNKTGTTSLEDGSFNLTLPGETKEHRIFISSLGYNDTTLTVEHLLQSDTLYLKPTVYSLPDVVVSNNPMEVVKIGEKNAEILRKNGNSINYSASVGFSWGAYIEVKKKEAGGFLDTLNVFIGDKGYPEAPMLLRILKFKGKFKFQYRLPIAQFRDLLQEEVIVTSENSGWLTINLSQYNIKIPESGLYILFTPLEKGDKYRYKTSFGEKYGATIGRYADKKDAKQIYPVVQHGENLAVFKKIDIPAVAVSILKEQ